MLHSGCKDLRQKWAFMSCNGQAELFLLVFFLQQQLVALVSLANGCGAESPFPLTPALLGQLEKSILSRKARGEIKLPTASPFLVNGRGQNGLPGAMMFFLGDGQSSPQWSLVLCADGRDQHMLPFSSAAPISHAHLQGITASSVCKRLEADRRRCGKVPLGLLPKKQGATFSPQAKKGSRPLF